MTDANWEQVFQLRLQKVQMELDELTAKRKAQHGFFGIGPMLTTLLPVLALVFAVFQFAEQQALTRDTLDRQTQAHMSAVNREFMAPVLNSQAELYSSVITAAAQFTTSTDEAVKRDAASRFLEFYWGQMVMFESQDIVTAMGAMKFCIESAALCSDSERQKLSLFLASSLQKDHFNSWPVTPDEFADRDRNYREDNRGTADEVLSRSKASAQEREKAQEP